MLSSTCSATRTTYYSQVTNGATRPQPDDFWDTGIDAPPEEEAARAPLAAGKGKRQRGAQALREALKAPRRHGGSGRAAASGAASQRSARRALAATERGGSAAATTREANVKRRREEPNDGVSTAKRKRRGAALVAEAVGIL